VSSGWYYTGNISSSTTPGPVSGTYAMILDQHGTPVWYQAAPGGAINVEPLPNDTVAWAPSLGPGIGTDPNGAYSLYQLDTQSPSSQRAPVPPTDPHELYQMANGHRMMISTPLKQEDASSLGPAFSGVNNIVDCVVQEVDGNGQLKWQWNMSDHVDIGEAKTSPMLASVVDYNGQNAADVYHCNSVEVDPATGNVLVSSRNTNALYLIDKSTKAITWKLGGTSTNKDGAKILQITNDPETKFSGQHDARFQANGDVSIYDDHTGQAGAARGVEYAIDTTAGTATWTWQYAAPDGKQSFATGGFRRYANGTDNIVCWGIKQQSPSGFSEVDGAGSLLMNLTFPNGELNYRAVKVPQASLDVNLLRRTAGLPRPVSPTVNWQSLGGVGTSKPASASWGNGRLDVVVRGTDQQLWHTWWDGSWHGWEPLGGVLSSGPGIASWGTNRLDVVAEGTDHQLWHKWWDGSRWNGWEPLGGVLSSGPGTASWGTNRLDVVVKGTDNEVWHKWWDGSRWNGWEPLGGQTSGDPAASSWGPGRLDVFIANTDGTLGHRWLDAGQWSSFEWFAANLAGGPAATSASPGQVDVLGSEPGRVPLRFEYTGTWQNWQSLGGRTAQTPSVTAVSSNTEMVFATGTDSAVWVGALSTTPPAASTPRTSAPSQASATKL
jgi:hypothetical protein